MGIRSKIQQSEKFYMMIALTLFLMVLPGSVVSAEEGWTSSVSGNESIPGDYQRLLGTSLDARPPSKDLTVLTLPEMDLPEKYDWREYGPEVPVRNQGDCAACWAFAFVGVLERLVAATDGVSVRFSEQWVLDCNNHGWNCDFGWNPYDMVIDTDTCGEAGLVLESVVPYQETELTCECSKPRTNAYDFVYEGSIDEKLPFADKVNAIKQAILSYGPVWTALHAGNMPFFNYTGGVFDYKPSGGSLDHSAVIEGWDDTRGAEGVWILRNSWGDQWGDKGYMYIEYDSCFVGSYIDVISYAGAPAGSILVTIEPQEAVDAGAYWTVDGGTTWLNSGAASLNVAPGDHTISYKDVAGFETPPDESVTVGAREAIVRTGTYLATDGEAVEDISETPEDADDDRCGCWDTKTTIKCYLDDWLLI